MAAFAVAAIVIVLLLFGLSLAIASAQEQLVSTLQASMDQIKRWGGRILILVGLWLVVLAIWADAFAQVFPV